MSLTLVKIFGTIFLRRPKTLQDIQFMCFTKVRGLNIKKRPIEDGPKI